MNIQIVTPFQMQWVAAFKKHFESIGWEVSVHDVPKLVPKPDVQLLMWLNEDTVSYLNSGYKNGCKTIVFVRRYEFYTDAIEQANWENADAIVMVNPFLAWGFKRRTGIEPLVIPNGVDVDAWNYKDRSHGDKIAVVGFINQRKNIPLALQILANMGKKYTIHFAGGFQDGATVDYIANFAKVNRMEDRIFLYGQFDHIDHWLEDKDYLLCTSISEGCPNNVLEAMAKGIKPVVHHWPGANKLFEDYIFNTIDQAIHMMSKGTSYCSRVYRAFVENNHGKNIYKRITNLINNVIED